jgi:hypothetical protein
MIIDNIQQLEHFDYELAFLYPITKDRRLHNSQNSIVGFVIINLDTRKCITISNGHPEGVFNSGDLSFLKNSKVYCYNTAILRYNGFDVSQYTDVDMQYYLYCNAAYLQDTPSAVNHYTRQFAQCYRINELIPLLKHEQFAQDLVDQCWVKNEQSGLSFYQDDLLSVFYSIERNGIQVDVDKFNLRFGKTLSLQNNKCFTQYNYYTTTGRPSNRFGGINFAALNKTNDTREAFISRYQDGALVEIDFNSYHPRLIAQLIDYDFGDDNVYEHLATHYYNTPTPSKEEIENAKEATFRQLYGGIQQQYLHIPFFAKTNELAKYLWNRAEKDGYIESPISRRRLMLHNYQDVNMYVLFNYFIQMYETEHNVLLLGKLFEQLDDEILPVLYTYDSLLFDLPQQKCEMLKQALQHTISSKFPYKLKSGHNYASLI